MTAARVEIVEVGPRDGLQSEPEVLATRTKVEFIRRARASGIRRIEVASFVNPARVPQMADAEQVVAELPPENGDIRYIGLVMNRLGFERARDAGLKEIGFIVVASDTFNRRNQRVGTDDSIADFDEIAAAAREAGMRVGVAIAAAYGCPFEGEVPASRVFGIAERLAASRPDEITLADSIGVGVPAQVKVLFEGVRKRAPDTKLRAHFHNTRNTGLANAWAAVEIGVQALDASAGGIGGCPFAPAATGNIPTEDLVYMLERAGIETGVSLDKCIETGKWLQETLGRPVPGMLLKAGGFPRAAA